MVLVEPGEDGIRLVLQRPELDLLVRLAEGLADRLRAGGEDPVIERLAPPASIGDAEADHELRRMLRSDLLDGRAERLVRFAAELLSWRDRGSTEDPSHVTVIVAAEVAMHVVQGLNDIRLALGAQIAVEALDRDAIPDGDPRGLTLELMDRLGGLQHGLIELLDAP